MTTAVKRIFKDKDEFYDERGGRFSGESDFGVYWRSGNGFVGDLYRISVVHDTGDIYAAHSQHGTVVLLITLPFGCVYGPVHSDKTRCPYEISDKMFEGYAEVCGQPNSFEWFKARCHSGY